MRRRTIVLAALVLSLASALAGQEAAQTAPPVYALDDPFPSGAQLNVRVRSGDVRIVGGAGDRIKVRFAGKNAVLGREIAVHLARTGQTGDLRIEGGPREDIEILLEVPRRVNLRVRMPAGALAISGITGDKDVRLHFGDLTIDVGDPQQYGRLETTVTAGGISARPFAADRGGLFRSFKTTGAGTYRLQAHVGAGDLTLR
jgi:hypothetical protein